MSRRALVLMFVATTLLIGGWKAFREASPAIEMSTAAEKFLAGLTPEQRATAVMEFGAPQRLDWHFIPKDKRKGLQIRDMNPEQRASAHRLLKTSLSEIGYGKATKIMALESLLKALAQGKQGGPLRDSERYYFTVFGKPSAEGKWGLSVEGHHLSLNFVVEKNRVISSTPAVFCTNPAIVMNDVPDQLAKGTRVLAKEEVLAFELVHSLSADQKKVAIIAAQSPQEVRAAGEAQPPQTAPEGIAAKDLNNEQKKLLKQLVEVYLLNHPEEVAAAKRDELETAGWDELYFCWAGAEKPGVGHYYRIQGPTLLIEFVNVQPDAAGNPANHIHSIWRDMRGDFAIPAKK